MRGDDLPPTAALQPRVSPNLAHLCVRLGLVFADSMFAAVDNGKTVSEETHFSLIKFAIMGDVCAFLVLVHQPSTVSNFEGVEVARNPRHFSKAAQSVPTKIKARDATMSLLRVFMLTAFASDDLFRLNLRAPFSGAWAHYP